jgi:uncharacterized membrane protein
MAQTHPRPIDTSGSAPAQRDTSYFLEHIVIRPIQTRQLLHWLARGMHDYRQHPLLGLFYGTCFVLMAQGLLAVFRNEPAYTLATLAGLLLLGPFLWMGLYQVSRRMEQQQSVTWFDSLTAWRSHLGQMGVFGFVLLVLELLWGRASLVVFAVSFDGMPDFKGSVMALFNPENIGFIVTYLAVASIFAGLIFSVSVISVPMMLDQEVDAITAGLTSLRLVLAQPGVMLLWATLIAGLTLVALLPNLFGLLVIGPVIGHASWHAYRDCIAIED